MFRTPKKNYSSCVYVLHKTCHQEISRPSHAVIKRDLLKQRHAKITERFKARRFGVILTPLSREQISFKNQF